MPQAVDDNTVAVPQLRSRTTKIVEEFLCRAQGLRKGSRLRAMHPDFAWALSSCWLESPLLRSAQDKATNAPITEPVAQYETPKFTTLQTAARVPLDCRDKILRAQELLEHAYAAPYSGVQHCADVPQGVMQLTGKPINSPAWKRITEIATAHVAAAGSSKFGFGDVPKGSAGSTVEQQSSDRVPASVAQTAQHVGQTCVLPVAEVPSVSCLQPCERMHSESTAASHPCPPQDSAMMHDAVEQVLGACKQSCLTGTQDLNAAVQAALEGILAPLSHETVNSLARILEATVSTFVASVSAVACSHILAPKASPEEGAEQVGQNWSAHDGTGHIRHDSPQSSTKKGALPSRTVAEDRRVLPAATVERQEHVQLLVQAHMWLLLMAQTEHMFGYSYEGKWSFMVKELQEMLSNGAQAMSQVMKVNSAALQWRQLMIQTMHDAHSQLALAEGNASLKASEVCKLERKVESMQHDLREADEGRSAAEAAVIELVPLHLTVSQLRQRLAAEMTAFTDLQEAHAFVAAQADRHRAEATAYAADKAHLTGQVLALRDDLRVMGNDSVLASRRADLAESTQKLDRDEIDTLKRDAEKLQNEHAADLEYITQLELKRKMLEDEIGKQVERLAHITASESALRTQKAQADESVLKLTAALGSETSARIAAEALVAEYEVGVERRLRKLESEIQAKDSRIHLLEEDVSNGVTMLESQCAKAAESEEKNRIAYMRLEASLEVKVSERVQEQTMEVTALNEMVRKAQIKETQAQEKHKAQLASLHANAEERVAKANQAAAAAEQARLQLQQNVTTQLADVNKRCHQAEAKTQAVERKSENHGRAFKMRILTLEATIKDLKQTIEDLRGQIDVQTQDLAVKNEELDLSQAREMLLSRELEASNDKFASQESCIRQLMCELESSRSELKLAAAAHQEAAKQQDAAAQELHNLLKSEHRRLCEAENKIKDLEKAGSELSGILVENERRAKQLEQLENQINRLQAEHKELQMDKDSVERAHAVLQTEFDALIVLAETLSVEKAELEHKLKMFDDEGVHRDDDSAEGEEGSRPSSRQGSRPTSLRGVGKRTASAGSTASQNTPTLPPIRRTRQSGSVGERQFKTLGQDMARMSTCLPVRQEDDGIWISRSCIPSGWTVVDGVLVIPKPALQVSEHQPNIAAKSSQSIEYIEAQKALEAVKRAHLQSEVVQSGDPASSVHITEPFPGNQNSPPRQAQQARPPSNPRQHRIPTQDQSSTKLDRKWPNGGPYDRQQGAAIEHSTGSLTASDGQIAVVGSAPAARRPQTCKITANIRERDTYTS